MYDATALERGIKQAHANIKTFEDAIEKERATIREYYAMIDTIGRKARASEDLAARVEVDDGG